jgi:SOS-response transcriptional repressor LexA
MDGDVEGLTSTFTVITAPLDLRDGQVYVPETAMPADAADVGACWVQGDCMTGAGIEDGDVVVFILQDSAQNGDVVVARVGGDPLLKMFWRHEGRTWLLPVTPDARYPSVPGDDAVIVGRVVTVVHPR